MISEGSLILKNCVGGLDELIRRLFDHLQKKPETRVAFWGKSYPACRTLVEFRQILGDDFHPVCVIDNFKCGSAPVAETPILSFEQALERADSIDLIAIMVDSASIYSILEQIAESKLSGKAILCVHRDADPLTETEFARLSDACHQTLTRKGVLWYTSPENWRCCYQYLQQTASLEGDVAEFGVYQGGSAFFIATVMRELGMNKRLHLFDSFSGIQEQSSLDQAAPNSFASGGPEGVRALMSGFDGVNIVAGDIFETFAGAGLKRLSLAHIDCDQYATTRFLCESLYPLMASGGIMMFQDYAYGAAYGERVAVDAFFRDKPEAVLFGYDRAAFVVKL